MSWAVEFLPEALQDMEKLDHSVQVLVVKGIKKVSQNPLPNSQGGYGKPLGSHSGNDLTNLLKIKFRDIGIRVIYKVVYDGSVMKIIVISARSDSQVYKEAARRRRKNDL